jgi:hypothetical protein
LLHSHDMDLAECSAFSGSSVVAAIAWWLTSHCLAMDVFTELFTSNGCPWWLHNSGFQETCYIIYIRGYFVHGKWMWNVRICGKHCFGLAHINFTVALQGKHST